MLKAAGFLIKLLAFSTLILMLGNWLRWDGKTVSDQVRLHMAHADESGLVSTMRDWAEQVTHDARKGFQKKLTHVSATEEIPSSERQKLKALIRELNSSQKKD
jgi:hypothetical protein